MARGKDARGGGLGRRCGAFLAMAMAFAAPAAARDIIDGFAPEITLGYVQSFVRETPPEATAPAALLRERLAEYAAAAYVSTDARKQHADRERYCLAQAVYHEARGEPEAGQWAVASVILNRVQSRQYPDTVCAVVFQNAHLPNRCQFSFACDGRPDDGGRGNTIDRQSWLKSHVIAHTAYRKFLEGRHHEDGLATAMHFHTRSVNPHWASAYVSVAAIGAHIFY